MPLTDSSIRAAKPSMKPSRHTDGGGLYLEVSPSGGKWWRYKYRFEGKEKRLSLGVYPDVSLKEAREKHQVARKLLANGIDPSAHRKAQKTAGALRSGNTFEAVALEWFAKQDRTWVRSHSDKVLLRLRNDVFPWLGVRPVDEIAAPELLSVLERIERRGAIETAHRVLQNLGQIFRYAIATGRALRNPASDLRGALTPVSPTHRAAITDPVAIGALLRAIDSYKGALVTKCALALAPLVFVRPGELRKAEWSEIDFENALWSVPAERMKTRQPHLIPLSSQAVSVLRELHAITGQRQYVFPGAHNPRRPMSDNAVLSALRRMGYAKDEMSGHGFRAMARTVLDEVLGIRPDFIEHQLAHAVRDPNGRAYNRTAFLSERRIMMQRWADYLDELKAQAEISQ